jgi:hypothetical protein
VGRPAIINYISTEAGVSTTARLFTGRIEETSWDPLTRLLSCACSDQLQQRVEQLSIAEVDALTPCYWPATGRPTCSNRPRAAAAGSMPRSG